MTGLQLDGGTWWTISRRRWDAELGFAALPKLAGSGATLYLEGGVHSDEVAAWIAARVVPPAEPIARGTIWPRQAVYHLPATAEVFAGLSRLASCHAVPEICDHLVIYRNSQVLVDWYDAFDRDVYASRSLEEWMIREFAELVGGVYRIEKN